MNLRILQFPLMIIVFLLSTHWFLYFSTLKFFSITGLTAKNVLAIIYGLLSISFIVAIILMRFSDFFIFRFFYAFSAFWLGLMIYLVIACLLAWIVILFFKSANYNIKLVAGTLAFVLAFLYSIYGVWNAFHPIVKNVEIKITGLPAEWENKKIVHISDAHLGRIHGRSFARKIVEKINKQDPDLILITGDLFDGIGSDLDTYANILNKLESRQGIYFVTGNHEGYLGVERIIKALENTKINILNNELVEIDGVQIIGVSFPELDKLKENKNIIMEIEGYNPDLPNILLHHEPVSIEQKGEDSFDRQSSSYFSPDTDYTIAKESGINLQLSGHTHKGQFFPFDLITKKIYNGYDYGLFTKDDFNIYITNGVGTWGPPIRTGNRSEIVVFELY